MPDETDDLYALPLDEFTAARDALAKRLRVDKQREEADAVKALRRPSIAAWAINQAVREHGADELLSAGEELRAAYESLMAGGDRDEARSAADAERDAVRALTRHAVDALGDRASEATTEKIRTTLHAASTDDELRERIAAGRLEKEVEAGASGFPLAATGAAPSGRAEPRPKKKPAPKAPKKKERATAAQSSRAKSGRSQAERRRAAAAERARKAAERATEAHEQAEASAERARSALAEAEAASRKARAVVEELEAQERSARRAVKEAEAEAERRKTEARRALKEADARA